MLKMEPALRSSMVVVEMTVSIIFFRISSLDIDELECVLEGVHGVAMDIKAAWSCYKSKANRGCI